jgi:3-hydroxyisobutyrate dehydrogenase-like beta-hydroxyacid dehydrogenase
VLQSFSANVIHMGGLGTGTVAKLCQQHAVVLQHGRALRRHDARHRLWPRSRKLLHVIATRAATPTPSRTSPAAADGHYSPPSFALDLAYKDLHLALELGDELGVPLQQGASTHNLQRLAKGMGWGPDDSSSVLRVYETMLRRKVKP